MEYVQVNSNQNNVSLLTVHKQVFIMLSLIVIQKTLVLIITYVN